MLDFISLKSEYYNENKIEYPTYNLLKNYKLKIKKL